MKWYNSNLLLSTAILVALQGCIKSPRYQPKKLTKLSKTSSDFEQTQNNVTLRVKKFAKEDYENLFGVNGKYLEKRNSFYPLQLTLVNHSEHPWILNQKSIPLKLASHYEIAQKLQFSPAGKIVFFSSLSFLSGSLCLLTAIPFGISTAFGFLPIAIPTGIICISSGLCAVSMPFIGLSQAFKANSTNTIIDMDISSKALDAITIESGTTESTLIFVKKKAYKNEFTLTLWPAEASNLENLLFNIDLT